MKALVLALVLSCGLAQASLPENFHKVNDGVYRGALPSEEDLATLANMGIRTVINLHDDGRIARQERSTVTRLGMKPIAVPLSPFFTPDHQDIDTILAAMNDPQLKPIFLHCLHGEDRTGLLVGLYRVFTEAVPPATAYREMLDLGFHRYLLGLKRYYKDRTGWDD